MLNYIPIRTGFFISHKHTFTPAKNQMCYLLRVLYMNVIQQCIGITIHNITLTNTTENSLDNNHLPERIVKMRE